jgi:hypothetical protein
VRRACKAKVRDKEAQDETKGLVRMGRAQTSLAGGCRNRPKRVAAIRCEQTRGGSAARTGAMVDHAIVHREFFRFHMQAVVGFAFGRKQGSIVSKDLFETRYPEGVPQALPLKFGQTSLVIPDEDDDRVADRYQAREGLELG